MSLYEKSQAYPDGLRECDVKALAEAGKVYLVDVREPMEWTGPLGHVASAELVPMQTVPEKAKSWDKAQEIVLICKSGGRSAQVGRWLRAQGFESVINVRGGMMAWNEAGLPVAK